MTIKLKNSPVRAALEDKQCDYMRVHIGNTHANTLLVKPAANPLRKPTIYSTLWSVTELRVTNPGENRSAGTPSTVCTREYEVDTMVCLLSIKIQ